MLDLLVAASLFAAPADNEKAVFVAILPLGGTGLSDDRRALVLETVRAQLGSDRILLVPQADVERAVLSAGDCGAPETCQRAIAENVRAEFLVRVSASEPKESDFDVSLTVLDPRTNKIVATFDETCRICSEADLKRLVQERSIDAKTALERHLTPKVVEAVEKPVPAQTVEPSRVEVQLADRSKLGPIGWGLFGAGAAATLGGVALMAMHGKSAGCPADPRGGGCLPLVHRTLLPGAITAGVGLIFVGTGVGLVVAGKRRDQTAAETATAKFEFTPAGAMVSGRF